MQEKLKLCGGAIIAASVSVSSVFAQELQPVLSTASAKAIVSGCEAYAIHNSIDVAIAVTGPGDMLVAFQRMGGALPGAGDVAIWKAISSSNFGLSSKQFATIVEQNPVVAEVPKVAALEGGEAIYTADGTLIGGVGVSGAKAWEDAACARAGLARAQLEFKRKSKACDSPIRGNLSMTDVNDDLGTIVKDHGYYQATLTRVIAHSIESVWETLTNPVRLVDWLAPGKIELAEGGSAILHFEDSGTVIDSVVSKCKEHSVLEYSWSSGDEPLRPVCWQLVELNGSTQLTLVLGVPEDEDVSAPVQDGRHTS